MTSTCSSRFPNDTWDMDGRRRPYSVAVPRDPSATQKTLAASLYCYVSDDDMALDRREFLAMVRDRIDLDLQTGEY